MNRSRVKMQRRGPEEILGAGVPRLPGLEMPPRKEAQDEPSRAEVRK